MDMKGILFTFLIAVSFFPGQGTARAEHPADLLKWQACRSSDDCTVGKDPCRNLVGVNKNYLKEYSTWSEKETWACRARGGEGPGGGTQILCLDHKCHVGRLTGTRTISPEEMRRAAGAAEPLSGPGKTKKGLTWGLVSHSDELGIDRVGCYGRPRVDGSSDGQPCNPYEGDTDCSAALPVLCLKAENLPRPNYAVAGTGHAMPVEYYNGWAGGHIGLTRPVRGDMLAGVEAADRLCEAELGAGYRMAEHHDGRYVIGMNDTDYHGKTWPPESELSRGGWHWYAFGSIPGGRRFWVHINDQRQGNCWAQAERRPR